MKIPAMAARRKVTASATNVCSSIVSRETWERANELVAVKRREYKETLKDDLNIFSGLLKCADCGKALSRRKYGSNSSHMIYVCGTYATYGSHKCTQHKIFEEDLTAAMLADIQELFSAVKKDKAKLIDLLIKNKAKNEGKALNTKDAQYKRVCKRLEEVNRLVDKLYEDNISGKINETNFVRLLSKYQQEQESILAEKERLESETAAVREIRSDAEQFADLLERYGDITELTPEILNMLVDKLRCMSRELLTALCDSRLMCITVISAWSSWWTTALPPTTSPARC